VSSRLTVSGVRSVDPCMPTQQCESPVPSRVRKRQRCSGNSAPWSEPPRIPCGAFGCEPRRLRTEYAGRFRPPLTLVTPLYDTCGHVQDGATLVYPTVERTKWTLDTTARYSRRVCQCLWPQGWWPEMGERKRTGKDRHLTIDEVCADLDIARSTFYDWRAKKRAPRCIRLPNGAIRIRRTEYEHWLDSHEEAA
jgi:predicted DNA-binding transcriptional regulator AlpA